MRDSQKLKTKRNQRATIGLTGDIHDSLTELAEIRGKSKAAVIRDALELEKWFQEIQEEGAHIFVERNGKARRVVRR